MSYREPTYLAKVAATVDAVSEGRLEMGIGAGWYEHEWRAYGYGFPSAGERLARLREGVEIMRQMWTTGRATLDGEHYQVDGAMCFPQPLQGTSVPGSKANGIPMWVAGGGERKTLRIAAEYADYTNFDGSPGGVQRQERHPRAALQGHRPRLRRDRAQRQLQRRHRPRRGARCATASAGSATTSRAPGCPADVVDEQVRSFETGPLVGTPEQIVERLHDLESRGMTYAITNFAEQAYDLSGVELFEREVLPELVDRERHGHLWHLLHGE